ncbi:anti-sigma factor [Cyanobacteria bacterium FACHB-63]|nr:anti-sigma factor [Cyanobacteria bacterium FACHB-63]
MEIAIEPEDCKAIGFRRGCDRRCDARNRQLSFAANGSNHRSIVETLQQPNTRFYTLRETDKAANASGSVVINSSQNALVVSIQNLPDLPADQAYGLWAIPQGSTQALCGQFSRDEAVTGQWSRLQADCGTPVAQLLVTAESVVAPPIPAGPLVMKSLL